MDQRKRSRDEFEADRDTAQSLEPSLGESRHQQLADLHNGQQQNGSNKNVNDAEGGWETVSRSKKRKKLPKKDGNYPAINHSSHARLQSWVKLTDLQNLVLYVLADGTAPQWCSVAHRGNFRKAVVLMVAGLEASMFDGRMPLEQRPTTEHADTEARTNGKPRKTDERPVSRSKSSPDSYYPSKLESEGLPAALQPFAKIFPHIWPIRTPGDDKYSRMHSPLQSLLTSPIPKPKESKHEKGPAPASESKSWKDRRTRITEFLTSIDDLLLEGYVLHPAHFGTDVAAAEAYQATRRTNHTSTDDGWVDSPDIPTLADGDVPEAQIEQGSVTAGRKILAIDCEMCITSPAEVTPPVFSLTRMSVTDWDGYVVLDELVKPKDPITNYVTAYSGITPQMMENVTTTLQDAQQKLLAQIDRHTILVGHSLNSDLNALRVTHPFIIDTALLYPHPRGPPLKSSLKWLAQKYLSRAIQTGHGTTGHNSIEDAKTSLELVRQKCEKGKAWGTSEATNESIFARLGRAVRPKRDKIRPDGDAEPRIGAVVDWGEPKRGLGSAAKVTVGCKSDEEVVAGIKRVINGNDDSPESTVHGVDFIWGRLRELEAHRGWWRTSKTADLDEMREAVLARTAGKSLSELVSKVSSQIQEIWESLPPCTALIVYSGSGDPRMLSDMQEMQRRFKTEYATKKWDQLTVKWTDKEEQDLRRACYEARGGIGFIAVK